MDGSRHNPLIYIGEDATPALLDYLEGQGLRRVTLVADANTHRALGERVARELRSAGLEVAPVILEGPQPLAADEVRLVQALVNALPGDAVFVSVGAGTVTDITRFASYHSRSRFIALPTAASMDGYATSNNTLLLEGLKVSRPGHAPEAIFCDLPTLGAAPRAMNAAGLGDTLAKFTSVNDLRLGHLIWGERTSAAGGGADHADVGGAAGGGAWERDESIAARMEGLAQTALMRGGEIAAGERASTAGGALAFLIRALLDSGLAMADFGNSMPGGGAEHHMSHCWEMRGLLAGDRPLLHGAKVGVATVISAGWYAQIREMTQREAANRLAEAAWPDPRSEMADIRRVYGPLADGLIAAQQPFLSVTEDQFRDLKWRILDNWEEIRALAARIPSPEALADALRAAGGAGTPEELGLSAEEVEIGKRYGHFTRPRFTIARLRLLLGI